MPAAQENKLLPFWQARLGTGCFSVDVIFLSAFQAGMFAADLPVRLLPCYICKFGVA